MCPKTAVSVLFSVCQMEWHPQINIRMGSWAKTGICQWQNNNLELSERSTPRENMHEVWAGPLSKASGQIHASVWILMTQGSLIGLPETSRSVEPLMAGTRPLERGLFNFWEGASVLENAWYLWDDCVSFTATCLLEPSWGGTHDLMSKDRDNRSPSVQNESSVWRVGRGTKSAFYSNLEHLKLYSMSSCYPWLSPHDLHSFHPTQLEAEPCPGDTGNELSNVPGVWVLHWICCTWCGRPPIPSEPTSPRALAEVTNLQGISCHSRTT